MYTHFRTGKWIVLIIHENWCLHAYLDRWPCEIYFLVFFSPTSTLMAFTEVTNAHGLIFCLCRNSGSKWPDLFFVFYKKKIPEKIFLLKIFWTNVLLPPLSTYFSLSSLSIEIVLQKKEKSVCVLFYTKIYLRKIAAFPLLT